MCRCSADIVVDAVLCCLLSIIRNTAGNEREEKESGSSGEGDVSFYTSAAQRCLSVC